MKIKELAEFSDDRPIRFLSSNSMVGDAMQLITKYHIGAIPIIDNERLAGIFTERDVLMRVARQGINYKATPIAEVMTKNPNTINPDMLVNDAIQTMVLGRYRHLLVTDGSGTLIKVLSQRDLVAQNWLNILIEKRQKGETFHSNVSDLLNVSGSRDVAYISSSQNVVDAVIIMSEKKIGAIVIVDDGQLAGIFSERDLVTRVLAKDLDPETVTINQVMTKNPETVFNETPLQACLESMAYGNYRHLLVVDDDGNLCGILSQRDFICVSAKDL